jgi:hypothetical protein
MARSRGRGIEFLDVLPEDGERRLMLAVLIDAIQTYNRYRSRVAPIAEYHEWRRERAWFQTDDPANPFSFSNICAALGLSVEYVRRRVLRPSVAEHPVKVRRFAAKAEEAWARQRRTPQRALAAGGPAEFKASAPSTEISALAIVPELGPAVSYCI